MSKEDLDHSETLHPLEEVNIEIPQLFIDIYNKQGGIFYDTAKKRYCLLLLTQSDKEESVSEEGMVNFRYIIEELPEDDAKIILKHRLCNPETDPDSFVSVPMKRGEVLEYLIERMKKGTL